MKKAQKENEGSTAMKVVILLAGKSTRTHPLTVSRPKPLLPVANRTLLEHQLDALQGIAAEALLIVGYKKELIRKRFGTRYGKIRLRYVEQRQQQGSGHALMQVKRLLGREKGTFMVMYGDNVFCRDDVKACLRHENCILGCRVREPRHFGVLRVQGGKLQSIDEKPKKPAGRLINAGLYMLTKEVFSLEAKRSRRGELELTDMVAALAKRSRVKVVRANGYWFSIGYPWDLLTANEAIMKELKAGSRKCTVEKNATLKGAMSIGNGTVVKSGAYIEGPVIIGENCTIGPNCFIRPYSAIGNQCKVGNGCEVKNSILFDNVSVGHLSYVGDSVLGEGVNLGAGTITANLRHDNGNVFSLVKNEFVDSGKRKLGAILGDSVHTGIHTSIYPGRKMWPGTSTHPGDVVRKDSTA